MFGRSTTPDYEYTVDLKETRTIETSILLVFGVTAKVD